MKRTRVTRNWIKNWVNEKFKQLEIFNYECYEVNRTHFNQNDYECGACCLYIHCRHIESGNATTFLCFYPIWYIQQEINNGLELWLKFDRHNIIPNTTLELRKP